MKRVGICTMLYNNKNYGGNLQAYALNKICNDLGYQTETITYRNNSRLHTYISNIKQLLLSIRKNDFNKRVKRIVKFRKSIPHSKLYYKETIHLANKKYDCFIAGSDQIWNPSYVNEFYSLSFVEPNKTKIAYAASIGKSELSEEKKEYFKSFLKDYSYISVREDDAVSLLNDITGKKIILTLDPTLLLSAEEWSSIIKRKLIDENYMFCYFLNDSIEQRKVATEYAKAHNLKIVTLPYLSYSYRSCDNGFGDYLLYDVGPEDFVSLIKYAECVFTDSFHGTVFSHIFGKQFIVFDDMKTLTGSRLKTLTKMFGTEQRYIKSADNMNLKYIDSLPKIDFSKTFNEYRLMKEQSLSFLKQALGKE